MSKYIKKIKSAFMLMLCVALTLSLSVMAFAADDSLIDLNERGSISVTATVYGSDASLGSYSLELYKIADVVKTDTNNIVFEYTKNFEDCDPEILIKSEMTAEDANMFAQVIQEQEITPTQAHTGTGTVAFYDLDLGLYLVGQKDAVEGYEAINSFLVSVPMWNGSRYIYAVDASPKTEPVSEIPPEVSEPGNNGGSNGSNNGSSNEGGNGDNVNSNNGETGINDGNGGKIQTGDPFTEILRYALSAGVIAGAAIIVNLICGKRKAGECDE